MSDETLGKITAALFVTVLLIIIINSITGCVTTKTVVTGPNNYRLEQSIKAFGGGNIEKAAQQLGGTLKVYNLDGTPLVDVDLNTGQEAEGMTSDIQVLLKGIELGKILADKVP